MARKLVPRFPDEPEIPGSALGEKRWAVIADHYVVMDMTHDEARAHAAELKEKEQPGVSIATNETARRIMALAPTGSLKSHL